ncbi:MAG TPA: peptidoglycan DD-metalloendopeptidase family protein [Candidatus Nanopelagicales bacterium]
MRPRPPTVGSARSTTPVSGRAAAWRATATATRGSTWSRARGHRSARSRTAWSCARGARPTALRIVLQGRSGSTFFHGHMSQDLVHAASRVTRGEAIGLMGDSGSPGAVHLHFEYWKSGGESAAVNPAALLHSIC